MLEIRRRLELAWVRGYRWFLTRTGNSLSAGRLALYIVRLPPGSFVLPSNGDPDVDLANHHQIPSLKSWLITRDPVSTSHPCVSLSHHNFPRSLDGEREKHEGHRLLAFQLPLFTTSTGRLEPPFLSPPHLTRLAVCLQFISHSQGRFYLLPSIH